VRFVIIGGGHLACLTAIVALPLGKEVVVLKNPNSSAACAARWSRAARVRCFRGWRWFDSLSVARNLLPMDVILSPLFEEFLRRKASNSLTEVFSRQPVSSYKQ
jgi:hypothetical protein